MLRVLRPSGKLIVLEFSQPYFWFRPFYYLYLKGILPWVARWLTGDRDAYLYLVRAFPNFLTVPGFAGRLNLLVFIKFLPWLLPFPS